MTLPIGEIICGDNCEVMATFPDDSIDLVVTSPPYDNLREYGGHSWDFEGLAEQLRRVIKPGGVIVWVVNDATVNGSETGNSFRQALHFMELGLNLHDTMIWNKPPAGANGSIYAYAQSSEYMFVISNGPPKTVNRIRDRKNITAGTMQSKTTGGRSAANNAGCVSKRPTKETPSLGFRTNVWSHNVGGDVSGHPAQFPEALARDHILSWSNEGEIVLDPFNGSGTTTKMAKHMGRQFIGIEINKEYCDIANRRLAQGVLF